MWNEYIHAQSEYCSGTVCRIIKHDGGGIKLYATVGQVRWMKLAKAAQGIHGSSPRVNLKFDHRGKSYEIPIDMIHYRLNFTYLYIYLL